MFVDIRNSVESVLHDALCPSIQFSLRRTTLGAAPSAIGKSMKYRENFSAGP